MRCHSSHGRLAAPVEKRFPTLGIMARSPRHDWAVQRLSVHGIDPGVPSTGWRRRASSLPGCYGMRGALTSPPSAFSLWVGVVPRPTANSAKLMGKSRQREWTAAKSFFLQAVAGADGERAIAT